MQQPRLGKQLAILRREKGLTQEELAEKSFVSVRTIQRIEAGEVLPRTSTVKILLEAQEERFESFITKQEETMETLSMGLPLPNRNTVLVAAIAAAVNLVAFAIVGVMDTVRLIADQPLGRWADFAHTGLVILGTLSFAFFARGFVTLAKVFDNSLLKITAYLLMAGVAAGGILQVVYPAQNHPGVWGPYLVASVLIGALGIAFGAALIRLQDGMGKIARVAGILEIVMGCARTTFVLSFVSLALCIPAMVIEILLLYRGYEYLSRAESAS